MEKILYMDLDDTVKDTDKYITSYLRCNNFIKGNIGSSYNLINTKWSYLVTNILDNWDIVPFKDGAENGLSLLKTEYKVIFASGYTTDKEAQHKEAFAKELGCGIILVTGKKWDKSHINMRGASFVDDRSDILIHSNADNKYEMYNPFRFNLLDERDDRTMVVDWYTLVEKLMGTETSQVEEVPLLSKFYYNLGCVRGQYENA